MYSRTAAILVFLLSTTILGHITPIEPIKRSSCPLTKVNGYTFGCGERGRVQKPRYLRVARNVTSVEHCASICLSDPDCKSTRYSKELLNCVMYRAYLDAMLFTTHLNRPGIFNDRMCYSQDCNTIDACAAISHCHNVYYNGYRDGYTDFACGYGVTADINRAQPKQQLLDGEQDACDAIQHCADLAPYGPFDLHYSIPRKQWVCIVYNNKRYKNSRQRLNPYEQHIHARTLTVQNSSVGAAYGYYWSSRL